MNTKMTSSEVFEIDEQPIQVTGDVADSQENPLALIENDIRSLLHRLATAKHEKNQLEKSFLNEKKRTLLAIIDSLDAFERVFEAIRDKQDFVNRQMKKWIGNFRTVRRLLENLLYEEGVREVENIDDGFDPKWHKAIDTISDPGKPNGTIVEQLQKGYVWQNAVLRKAEVVVIRNDN